MRRGNNVKDKQKLLPCPFCGAKGEFYISSYDGDKSTRKWWISVRCTKCNVELPNVYEVDVAFRKSDGDIVILQDKRNEAIEAWNRRP